MQEGMEQGIGSVGREAGGSWEASGHPVWERDVLVPGPCTVPTGGGADPERFGTEGLAFNGG